VWNGSGGMRGTAPGVCEAVAGVHGGAQDSSRGMWGSSSGTVATSSVTVVHPNTILIL
jgi:hypothetical protein